MKILCIVQARMGSSRLPGKVLKEINGYPMIYYTLTRLSKSRYIDEVILATSNKDIDTPLAEYVASLGVEVFRGSEENVLERYKLASDKYKGDIVIRITGDCPLIDPVIIDNAITKYLIYDYDYLRLDVPETFIRGFDVEVFSKQVLENVYDIVCSEKYKENKGYDLYREHVTCYIYNHQKQFKVGYLKGKYSLNKEVNLSVDTKEDFERVKNILLKDDNLFITYEKIKNIITNI